MHQYQPIVDNGRRWAFARGFIYQTMVVGYNLPASLHGVLLTKVVTSYTYTSLNEFYQYSSHTVTAIFLTEDDSDNMTPPSRLLQCKMLLSTNWVSFVTQAIRFGRYHDKHIMIPNKSIEYMKMHLPSRMRYGMYLCTARIVLIWADLINITYLISFDFICIHVLLWIAPDFENNRLTWTYHGETGFFFISFEKEDMMPLWWGAGCGVRGGGGGGGDKGSLENTHFCNATHFKVNWV